MLSQTHQYHHFILPHLPVWVPFLLSPLSVCLCLPAKPHLFELYKERNRSAGVLMQCLEMWLFCLFYPLLSKSFLCLGCSTINSPRWEVPISRLSQSSVILSWNPLAPLQIPMLIKLISWTSLSINLNKNITPSNSFNKNVSHTLLFPSCSLLENILSKIANLIICLQILKNLEIQLSAEL